MKHNKWIHQLVSALFACLLAVSSVGNLITGYGLPVAAMWKIWMWCAFASVAIAVVLKFPYSGIIMIGVAALTTLGLCVVELLRPYLQKQAATLVYCISSHYHDVYNWPLLGAQRASDVSVPLILWAFLVAFCVNWYICRRKHILLAIVPTVIPLVLCLLTADKVPGTLYAYLLLLGLVILLMSDWTRKKQPDQGVKLTLWLTVPISLALALLFVCNPQKSYVNRAGKIQKDLTVWFEEAREVAVSVITGTPLDNTANKKVNLKVVGSKNTSSRAVMLVNSPVGGSVYLRERDYDVYTGTDWVATAERKEIFPSGADSVGTLTVLTYTTRNTMFVPYYAAPGPELVGGAVKNEANLEGYSYALSLKLSQKTSLPDPQYEKLPDETKAWATELVTGITAGAKTDQEKVEKIQNYVRNSAPYNTNVDRMDSSYKDFAQWFLENSETGYCIHYATAATVLLRAAGIPARYVEGYAVDCQAGTDMVVSKKDAHTWVEYYDMETRAWCILEVTPGLEGPQKPELVSDKIQEGIAMPGKPEDVPAVNTPEKEPPKEESPKEEPPKEEPPKEENPEKEPPKEEPPEEEKPEEDPPEEKPPQVDVPVVDVPVVDVPIVDIPGIDTPGIDIPESELPTVDMPTEPSTAPEETKAPDPPKDSTTQKAPRRVNKWIIIAVSGFLLVFGFLLQCYVRIFRKRKLWNCGTPNVRTIWRWRQTRSLANRLKQNYPEELDDLAKKARFSQYEMQPSELQKYEDYRLTLMDLVAKKPWYQKIIFKWIFAIDRK